MSSISPPPQNEKSPDSESHPFDETIFSDESSFEPEETSRVLASGTPGDEDDRVSADASDIGIPKAPQIVHENAIPKVENPGDDDATDPDDQVAEFNDLQFPANPTLDEKETEIPDIGEQASEQGSIPELTTSLPSDPGGNPIVPGGAPGTLSTGLVTSPTVPAPAPDAPPGQPLPTGLNAPASITTGLNAPFSVSPPTAFDPGESPPGSNSSDPVFVPQIGLSGLPLPNGATGLPTAPIGQQFIPPGSAATNYAPTAPGTVTSPRATPYRGNPIFGPDDKPVITTSLPGYPAPNGVAPTEPSPATPVTISTSLSDTILQNRLSRPTQSASEFRSLQQQ